MDVMAMIKTSLGSDNSSNGKFHTLLFSTGGLHVNHPYRQYWQSHWVNCVECIVPEDQGQSRANTGQVQSSGQSRATPSTSSGTPIQRNMSRFVCSRSMTLLCVKWNQTFWKLISRGLELLWIYTFLPGLSLECLRMDLGSRGKYLLGKCPKCSSFYWTLLWKRPRSHPMKWFFFRQA